MGNKVSFSVENADYKPLKTVSKSLNMRMNLAAASILSDRYGVSDIDTIALALVVL